MSQNKKLAISSSNILRCLWLLILLLISAIALYGYQATHSYLTDKKNTVNNIATALQQRIDSYRYLTNHIYEKFANVTVQPVDTTLLETRLRPDVHYVEKPRKNTDTVIFGNHDSNTLMMMAGISDLLDTRWGAKKEDYAMYYLKGNDNSLSMVTTQSLKELTSRLKENSLLNSAAERRLEMLQQATLIDEQESFSELRKQRFQNIYQFSLRTTFNQPGQLATVIAFDLPINDLIPQNMARSRFLLLPDNNELDENETHTLVTLNSDQVEFIAFLPNASLKLVYPVPTFTLLLDLLKNNLWLLGINLLLLVLSIMGVRFARQLHIPPHEDLAAELGRERALKQEIITHLPDGLLVYDVAHNTVIVSNKIADTLMPHLSLQKMVSLAEQHHGVIQATINNEVYEIRIFRSQHSADCYLFLLHDQNKEMMVRKRLQQARYEYDKNVQARSLLLHNLGRELNQPLHRVHTLLGQLSLRPEETEQHAVLKQLNQSCDAAVELVDNITLLTNLETLDWKPAERLFSLSIMLDELLLAALPAINQKGLLLFHHFQLDPHQYYFGDIEALRKVLSLLLRYAITTTPYGKISLTVTQEANDPDRLIFDIHDSGAGISTEEISNLAYPFLSQAQGDRFHQGSGLTFFLCHKLCEKLNGRLEIRSKLDIGTRYTVHVMMKAEKKSLNTSGEKLLDGITALLNISSGEIRNIITKQLEAQGTSCIITRTHQNHRDYDVLLTDNEHQVDGFTLLLATDELGWQQLGSHCIRVNYNLHSAVIDAFLQLIEQQITMSDQNKINDILETNEFEYYEKQLKSSDYYSLFIETVPADIKKLYTEKSNNELSTLSQTAHRLKGVFAMLNLLPGKHLCGSLEQHIADGDTLNIENSISQIDFFVSRLLQGNQQHE